MFNIAQTLIGNNTLTYLINRINEVVGALNSSVISTNSNTTYGDSVLSGSLQVNSLVANTLFGGKTINSNGVVQSGDTLSILTDTIQIGNSNINGSINTQNLNATGNTILAFLSVSGNTTISAPLVSSSSMNVAGPVAFGSNLVTTGSAQFGSIMVLGNSISNANFQVNGILTGNTSTFNALSSNNATITSLNVISSLVSNTANVVSLKANTAVLSNATITAISANSISSNNATVTAFNSNSLVSNTASITTGVITSLTVSNISGVASTTTLPGLLLSSFATGGFGQTVIRQGNYDVLLRNDGSNMYLMQTASGNTGGIYNDYRPFNWNLNNGYVTIDGTGKGTTIGGPLTLNSNLNVGGATSVVGLTVSNHLTVVNDINSYRASQPSLGYYFCGSQGQAYYGYDGNNVQIAGGTNMFYNGQLVYNSGNFNPASKVNGDTVSQVGFVGGNGNSPYFLGSGSGNQIKYLLQSDVGYARSWDARSFPGIGRMIYGKSTEDGSVFYAPFTNGTNYFGVYWNGSDIINQIDSTSFAMQRVGQSDEKLKNIEGELSVEEALYITKSLKPTTFEFKNEYENLGNPKGRRLGFIAQELEHVSSNFVEKRHTTVTEDGHADPFLHLTQDTPMQMIAALTKSLQYALIRIEELEAKIV